MTLFWHQTGPLLKYESGVLLAESLNPQQSVRWRMNRIEMLKTGFRFIMAGLIGRNT